MKKLLSIIILSGIIMISASAQFNKSIGGTGSWPDLASGETVIATSDGGYLFAGFNGNYNNGDMFAVKTDASGNITWQRHYGTASNTEGAYGVAQLTDGNYVLGGYTMPYPSGTPVAYMVKFNASTGNIIWSRTLTSNAQHIKAVTATSDGGFLITGDWLVSGQYDVFAMKITTTGLTTWLRVVDTGATDEWGESIQPTSDGGFIIGGVTGDFYDQKVLLLKLTSLSLFSWAKSYECFTSHIGYSVKETSDGGFIIAGSASNGGNLKTYIVKTNSTGVLTWSKNYEVSGEHHIGNSIVQTSDGGYICVSEGKAAIKMDGSGNLQWTKKYHGLLREVIQSGTDYVICGETDEFNGTGLNKMLIAKTNSSGVNCADLPVTFNSVTHTTTTTSLSNIGSYSITLSSATSVWGTTSSTVLSQCNCTADAGANKNNLNKTCCTPPTGCTSVQIGTASAGNIYSWSPAYNLSSSTIAQPMASPCSTTVYTLEVTNPGTCLANTDQVTVTTIFADCCIRSFPLTDEEGENTILLYPNPTTGVITLEIHKKEEDAVVSVSVIDLLGKTAINKTNVAGEDLFYFDMTHLTKGVYTVNVLIGNKIITEKILLQ